MVCDLPLCSCIPPSQRKRSDEPCNYYCVIHVQCRDGICWWKEENNGDEHRPDNGHKIDGFLKPAEREWPFGDRILLAVEEPRSYDSNVREIHSWRGDSKDSIYSLSAAKSYKVEKTAKQNYSPYTIQWCLGVSVHFPESAMWNEFRFRQIICIKDSP